MKKINIKRPDSITEVLGLMKEFKGQSKCLAGGTDMLIAMRYNELPGHISTLIDISHLGELSYIREERDFICIGAGTTHSDIEKSPLLKKIAPVLADASRVVGSPQIRNRGTIGGNLITAAQCADTIPPLIVLDAVVLLTKKGSERLLKIEDFLTGPKETALEDGELMTQIRFRKPAIGSRQAFSKLIRREAVAKTRISVAAVALQDQSGKITELSISPGSVTSRPARFRSVEKILIDQIPTYELIDQAARAASEYMISLSGRRWSTPYKEPVLKTMVERILHEILEGVNE